MRKLKHTEGNAQAHTTVSGFKPEPVWLLNLHFNHYLLLGSCENWDKASKLLNSVSDTLKPLKKHQSLFLWPWFTCHFSISGSEWLHLLFLFFFFFFLLEMFQRWEGRLNIHQEIPFLCSGPALGKSTIWQGFRHSSGPDQTCPLIT